MPPPRDLSSFPTRRSSDLSMPGYFPELPYAVTVVGAGSGIGRQTATFIAGQGVSVTCIDRNLDGAKETAAAITSANGKAIAVADRKSTRLNSSHLGISYAAPPRPLLFPYTTLFRSVDARLFS